MKCIACAYEDCCSIKSIAKDITGCEGHSKLKKKSYLKQSPFICKRCGEPYDRDTEDGKCYLCRGYISRQ